MAVVTTTGVILPPDWLIMKKVAIQAEIAIIATVMKLGPVLSGKKFHALGPSSLRVV